MNKYNDKLEEVNLISTYVTTKTNPGDAFASPGFSIKEEKEITPLISSLVHTSFIATAHIQTTHYTVRNTLIHIDKKNYTKCWLRQS